jgi:hypothetical protein
MQWTSRGIGRCWLAFVVAGCSGSAAPATSSPVVQAPPPVDAGVIDSAPPPADARVPVITAYEKPAMDDDEADERASDKTPVPPLPAQKIPKTQPQNLCAVLAEVLAASPSFDALRSEEPPTATTDLTDITTTIVDGGGKSHWLAVWPRRKRSTKVELGEVLPVLRGCPALADYAGVRETIATDAGGKDEIIWTRAGKPRVTLVDRGGDLKLRVEP